MNVKIELPATYAIVSRSVGVEADLSKLSAEIIAKLALHGLTQKVADSAAGAMAACGHGKSGDGKSFADLTKDEAAKVEAWGKDAMAETLASLVAGNWSERREGSGATPLVARIRVLIGAMLRAEAKDTWKDIKDADDKEAQLDAIFDGQDDDFRAAIEAKAEAELEAEAKAKAETGKLAIGLKLK